jgi:dienelactone hydrolase
VIFAGKVARWERFSQAIRSTQRQPRLQFAMPIGALRVMALLLVAAGASACATAAERGSGTARTAPGLGQDQIPFTISKPDGPGPFPAVVIMHDCSGLGPSSSGAPGRWSAELLRQGYVVLIPDSFSTRGFQAGVCTDASPRRNDASPARRVYDAYAALAHLRALPFVDGRRVGIMGGSHGGTTTVSAMLAPRNDGEPLATERRHGFAAAVALYPGCVPSGRSWHVGGSDTYRVVAPLLILTGDKDDWTPAEACRKLAAGAGAAGTPVEIKVYPGAHHAFDSNRPVRFVANRINGNAPGGRGATTGGDPAAWADAIRQVTAFFGRHLNMGGRGAPPKPPDAPGRE